MFKRPGSYRYGWSAAECCDISGLWTMTDMIITANRLHDGVVVWLTSDLTWNADSALVGCFEGAAAARARQVVAASEQQNEIVAAYEIAVDGRQDGSMREQIRALGGPTIVPPEDVLQTTTECGPQTRARNHVSLR